MLKINNKIGTAKFINFDKNWLVKITVNKCGKLIIIFQECKTIWLSLKYH